MNHLVLLVIAAGFVEAARIPYYGQNKNPAAQAFGEKVVSKSTNNWINLDVKNDDVITVPIGGKVELECEGVGSPPPRLRWYHGSNFVSMTGFEEQNEIINTAIGKIVLRLDINCVMPHHQGVYTCSAVSGAKEVTGKGVTLIVEEDNDEPENLKCKRNFPRAPRIISWGPTLLEISERDITLPCKAVGYPEPDVYWINNKDEVIDRELSSSRFQVLENGALQIKRIAWKDMGTYTCVAQNNVGQSRVETFLYPVKKDN